jgi:hypothetical protein
MPNKSFLLDCESDLSDIETMAVTEKRVHDVESELGRLAQRIAKLEGHKEGSAVPQKSSNAALITVLSVLGIAVIWYWGWIGVQVVEHGKKLAELSVLLVPQKLIQTAANPTSKEAISAAKQILATATQQGVQIPPDVLARAGQKFINASRDNPDAWNASLAFLDYRTLLNADLAPQPPSPKTVQPNTKVGAYSFALNLKPKPGTQQQQHVVAVSVTTSEPTRHPEESARLELLSAPQAQGSGVAKIVITGGADELVLDDQYLKNVTVINADIDYEGGPVRLENVLFVNCRFHFANQQRSRDLGNSILRTALVNFSSAPGDSANALLGHYPRFQPLKFPQGALL